MDFLKFEKFDNSWQKNLPSSLWLRYAEKVIMKTKKSIIDPIGTASPDFSSGI